MSSAVYAGAAPADGAPTGLDGFAHHFVAVERVFGNVEHDMVPLAGHAFAADRPDWTADRLIRFFRSTFEDGA